MVKIATVIIIQRQSKLWIETQVRILIIRLKAMHLQGHIILLKCQQRHIIILRCLRLNLSTSHNLQTQLILRTIHQSNNKPNRKIDLLQIITRNCHQHHIIMLKNQIHILILKCLRINLSTIHSLQTQLTRMP